MINPILKKISALSLLLGVALGIYYGVTKYFFCPTVEAMHKLDGMLMEYGVFMLVAVAVSLTIIEAKKPAIVNLVLLLGFAIVLSHK